MKIKRDFVTNSSSTSFIIRCKSDAKMKDDFIEAYNGWRNQYIKKEGWKEEFQEPPMLTSDMVTSIGNGIFMITDFVPLHSGKRDTPQYIQDLSDKESWASELLEQRGIVLVTVDEKDLNEPGAI